MRALLFAGQGSQRRGMGADVFDAYPQHCALADDILGYSIRDLCLRDEGDRLRLTRYAQPALFTVHALSYLAWREQHGEPDILAGHSLGELNALTAAGVFDLDTGLRLVAERGRLMGEADGGAMAAVVGAGLNRVEEVLAAAGRADVEIANDNSATQVVISGSPAGVAAAGALLTAADPGIRCVPLPVSAAFHSRDMAPAAESFARLLAGTVAGQPRVPVVANVSARPYPMGGVVADLLGPQIRSRVRWAESMAWLIDAGVTEVAEIGRGRVLTGFWREALAAHVPARKPKPAAGPAPNPAAGPAPKPGAGTRTGIGSARFREVYATRHAYLTGSMYQGIASTDLVVRMARAGLFGFFGAGGLSLDRIEKALADIKGRVPAGAAFGMNLLHDMSDAALEEATVDLYLKHGVRHVEAAAFTRVTPGLVRFRATGAHRAPDGRPVARNQVLAKVSRPEVARQFLAPPPAGMLTALVAAGALTPDEAAAAADLPVAGDLCVESDSGGHTDGGVALALVPTLLRLRDGVPAPAGGEPVRVGAAGGIGTPEAVAACFLLGADFVLTGSINQCTPQAGTSDAVKDLLAGLDVQDVGYAPAGDLFELGSRVQVVRRGTMFAARGNQLYELYRRHTGLDDIDAGTRGALERTVFRRSLDDVWRAVEQHYRDTGRTAEFRAAAGDPRRRMALTFKWYFAESTRAALTGDSGNAANFQIHCGPAMGAFNRVVEGTAMQSWRHRDVDAIADLLMTGAAALLSSGSAPAEPHPAHERDDLRWTSTALPQPLSIR
ncbi:ACP S-malonyltransferase [Actinoplanes missouriensis]|uniref:ACP S-malonyltransferase n=1 Tax=Actinoplanes missouriensis TaxID=1866 RepID=UPI0034003508